jgi:selenocysteine lyase/cysteine desulfurase
MSRPAELPTTLPSQRHLFEVPEEVCYLNCAFMSPQLRSVREIGQTAVERKSQPWRIKPADFFSETEVARARFAGLIAAAADDVALVPSTTYGISTAAQAIPLGRRESVLVLAEEFPSNYYPWARRAEEVGARLRCVPRPADHDWTTAVLERIDSSVRVVALPPCRWDDGALLDLKVIGKACRRLGIALVLDATQSIGALPFSIEEVDPDFLVAATYKWLLGPYSYGFLYVAKRWHDARPLEEVWFSREGATDFRRLADYSDTYQGGARRFDTGERNNPILLPMTIRALDQIAEWGVERLSRTLAQTTERIAQRLSSLGCHVLPVARRAPHLLGIQLPAHAPPDLLERLAGQQIHVSMRGRTLRIAPHLHVTERDVERFLGFLEELCCQTQREARLERA